jgi:ribosomal protein S18 acetylase RimI-like enzyme
MQELSQSVRLDQSQVAAAVRVLTQAFMTGPIMNHLFPEERDRVEMLNWIFDISVRYCLDHGQVYSTPDVSGVACWLPPKKTELKYFSLLRLAGLPPFTVIGMGADGIRTALDTLLSLEKLHKKLMPRPHWYLWFIGVDPDVQGQGIGSSLLEPALAQADQDGVPCYLETQTEENVAFYRKHGFDVIHEEQLPGGGPLIWIMVREPAG